MSKSILVIVLLLCVTNSNAHLNEECINLHVIENAPIGFIGESGEPEGVHWAYLNEISIKSGLCINKSLLPYARLWQSISHGSHDGGIVFKSDSRADIVTYVELIRVVNTVVIPRLNIELKHYQDLKGMTIGKTRGTHLSTKFDNDEAINVIEVKTYDQAIKMLKHERIDAIAGSALVLSYQLNKHDAIDNVDLNNLLVLGNKEQWLQLSRQ